MTPPTGTEFVDDHYTLYLWVEDDHEDPDLEEEDDRSDEEYYGDH